MLDVFFNYFSGKEKIEKTRYNLLAEMKNASLGISSGSNQSRSFTEHLSFLHKITDKIGDVIKNPNDLLDDDYWKNNESIFSKNSCYWKTHSEIYNNYNKFAMKNKKTPKKEWAKINVDSKKSLKDIFSRKNLTPEEKESKKLFPTIQTYLNFYSKMSMKYITPEKIKELVGDADWMTVQQKALFNAVLLHYYRYEDDNEYLVPVYVNMILACLNTEYSLDLNIKKKIFLGLSSILAGSGPFILKILQQILISAKSKNSFNIQELGKLVFASVPGTMPKEFELLMDCFKISLRATDQRLSEYNINYNFEQSMDTLDPQILGSASIAEVHKITLQGKNGNENMEAIMKFIKPFYLFYYICECEFLLKNAWVRIAEYVKKLEPPADNTDFILGENPTPQQLFRYNQRKKTYHDTTIIQTRQLLLFFTREFAKEFDYYKEFVYTTLGKEIYNDPGLKSVSIITFEQSPFPLLIQQKAPGVTLDKVFNLMDQATNAALEKKKQDLLERSLVSPENIDSVTLSPEETNQIIVTVKSGNEILFSLPREEILHKIYNLVVVLLESWFRNTLFKNVIYHADLHSGNVMINKDLTELWLIDYGSCGYLDRNLQQKLKLAMIATSKFIYLTPPTTDSNNYNEMILKQKTIHKNNLKNLKIFIQSILNICEVKSTQSNMEFLFQKLKSIYFNDNYQIAGYTKKFEFGGAFLNVIEFSRDIGTCTQSSVLLFGRSTAYLSQLSSKVIDRCMDKEKCQYWLVDSSIAKNISDYAWDNLKIIKAFMMGIPYEEPKEDKIQ
jgi:hypothetical protein